MNCAMGHGSCGGRCCRRRGKWRMRTRTSSVLQSQKSESSERSSSGVSRSEEKTVVGVTATSFVADFAAGRFSLRDFMRFSPGGKNKLYPPTAQKQQKTTQRSTASAGQRRRSDQGQNSVWAPLSVGAKHATSGEVTANGARVNHGEPIENGFPGKRKGNPLRLDFPPKSFKFPE